MRYSLKTKEKLKVPLVDPVTPNLHFADLGIGLALSGWIPYHPATGIEHVYTELNHHPTRTILGFR